MFPELARYELLKHPFYQSWQQGELTQATLQCYARQYLHHVNAFPTYLSRIHSHSTNLEQRQIILRNLMEEEGVDANGKAHPVLWEQFAEGLGVTKANMNVAPFANTQKLLDTFKKLADQSYAAGLGALYAYERQIPEIAKTKIKGLKEFYNIHDQATLEFFEVHQKADEWHSQEVEALIAKLSPSERAVAEQAAITAAAALWDFLTGIEEVRTDKKSCCVH
jgi:pyrroloquinoline-quinone synthase